MAIRQWPRSLTSGSRAALTSRVSRDLGKDHLGAGQPFRRPGQNVAVLELHLGAELFQALKMHVHRPGTDGAAARQGDLGMALACQQGAEHQHAGAHLAHQVVGGPRIADVAGGQGDGIPFRIPSQRGLDLNPMLRQQPAERVDVRQPRHVIQGDRLVGQQARCHQLERGVLGPADRDLALERPAAADSNAVH
jgi:hypothetical protein